MARSTITEAALGARADFVMTILPYRGKHIALVGRNQDMITFELFPGDVTTMNLGFTKAAELLADLMERESGSAEAVRKLLLDPGKGLAARGHAALNAVFGSHWQALKEQLDSIGAFPMIEVRSDDFIIPWELLFDRSPGELAESGTLEEIAAHFWALNRVIGRQEIAERVQLGRVPSVPVRVGLIINDRLEFALREQEMLSALADAGGIFLEILDVRGLSEWTMIGEVNSFLSRTDIDIFHLACHAEVDLDDPIGSYLEIGEDSRYHVASLDQDPVVEIRAPLVFLNACATGIRQPMQTFDFVRRLWRKGARNIVAVEAAMESGLAMEFAEKFYGRLLGGARLGEAVLETRREIALSEATSGLKILSIFYTLYADPGLRFDITEAA